MIHFITVFKSYFIEMFPALLAGLFVSGIIHEFIPDDWVEKHLGEKGILPIVYSTIMGTIIPVCCWGSLPIAVSFHKKGASLGPIFAFLVATPATSINALFVSWRFMGFKFTIHVFFAVILMGIIMGLIGDRIKVKENKKRGNDKAHEHAQSDSCHCCAGKKSFGIRFKSVCKYAFIDMPKEIGLETMVGLGLAALVSTTPIIGLWIKSYLTKGYAYLFALLFGLVVYMCATMSVPLVRAFINKGMNIGAGMSLLVLGPIVSYGTILVLRKEFGIRTLLIFISSISALCLLAGYLFTLL